MLRNKAFVYQPYGQNIFGLVLGTQSGAPYSMAQHMKLSGFYLNPRIGLRIMPTSCKMAESMVICNASLKWCRTYTHMGPTSRERALQITVVLEVFFFLRKGLFNFILQPIIEPTRRPGFEPRRGRLGFWIAFEIHCKLTY